MATIQALLQPLFAAMDELQTVSFAAVAGLTIMAWDTILVLDREIAFFWSGEWTIPRILYFLNRYYPILLQIISTAGYITPFPTDSFCTAWLKVLLPIQTLGQQTILGGTYAYIAVSLHRHNRRIKYLVVILFVANLLSSTAIGAVYFSQVAFRSEPVPGIRFCYFVNTPRLNLYTAFISALVFESVTSLLVIRAVYHNSRSLPHSAQGSLLLTRVMTRDTILKLLAGLLTGAAQIFLLRFGSPVQQALFLGVSSGLLSSLCARLMLNMREAGRRSASVLSSVELTDMLFFSNKDSESSERAPSSGAGDIFLL